MNKPVVVLVVAVFIIGVAVGVKVTPGTSEAKEAQKTIATWRLEYAKLRDSAKAMDDRLRELRSPILVQGVNPPIARTLAKDRVELDMDANYQWLAYQVRPTTAGQEAYDSVAPIIAISRENDRFYLDVNYENPEKPGLEVRLLFPKRK
jgi:hypothetical protein